MSDKEEKSKNKKSNEGIPMSEEGFKEYEKTWSDMEDCFKKLDKECKCTDDTTKSKKEIKC